MIKEIKWNNFFFDKFILASIYPPMIFFHIHISIYLLQITLLQGKQNFPLVGPTSGYFWWAVP